MMVCDGTQDRCCFIISEARVVGYTIWQNQMCCVKVLAGFDSKLEYYVDDIDSSYDLGLKLVAPFLASSSEWPICRSVSIGSLL